MPDGKKLAPHLHALLETAETLNKTSDSINAILQAVENQLVEANIGLEIWLDGDAFRLSATPPTEDTDGIPRYTFVELGFFRFRDGWHIAARDWRAEIDSRDPEESSDILMVAPYPIAQASRTERIAALRVLPKLIQALEREARNAIKAIEEAKNLIMC